jgi:hypothetical protein
MELVDNAELGLELFIDVRSCWRARRPVPDVGDRSCERDGEKGGREKSAENRFVDVETMDDTGDSAMELELGREDRGVVGRDARDALRSRCLGPRSGASTFAVSIDRCLVVPTACSTGGFTAPGAVPLGPTDPTSYLGTIFLSPPGPAVPFPRFSSTGDSFGFLPARVWKSDLIPAFPSLDATGTADETVGRRRVRGGESSGEG